MAKNELCRYWEKARMISREVVGMGSPDGWLARADKVAVNELHV